MFGEQMTPSYGNAVDEHDENCRVYKECLKNAQDTYGCDPRKKLLNKTKYNDLSAVKTKLK